MLGWTGGALHRRNELRLNLVDVPREDHRTLRGSFFHESLLNTLSTFNDEGPTLNELGGQLLLCVIFGAIL